MIEPQVEHGGASSWFCIAANDEVFGEVIAPVGEAPAAAGASPTAVIANKPTSSFAAMQNQEDAPPCSTCGSIMVRSGSCYKCANCGTTSGCA